MNVKFNPIEISFNLELPNNQLSQADVKELIINYMYQTPGCEGSLNMLKYRCKPAKKFKDYSLQTAVPPKAIVASFEVLALKRENSFFPV